MLRAHPHRSADDVYVGSDVSPVNKGRTGCRRIEAGEDGPAKTRNRAS